MDPLSEGLVVEANITVHDSSLVWINPNGATQKVVDEQRHFHGGFPLQAVGPPYYRRWGFKTPLAIVP